MPSTDTIITSPSFPAGLPPLRSETEVRAERARYCEDCRFFRAGEFADPADGLRFGNCTNPAAEEKPSSDRFVSAALDTPPSYKYASIFRAHGECGPDAKLFEAKQAVAA